MNKVTIAVIAVIVIGGSAYAVKKNNDNNSNQATSSQAAEAGQGAAANSTAAPNPLDLNNYTEGANIGDTVNAIDKSKVNISINDFIFKTTYLKIRKGTMVTWTNDGQISHTVTSADTSAKKGLSSGMLENGASYNFTFDDTGVYEYHCSMHPEQMKGVITVVD